MELYYKKLGNGPALFILHGLYGSGDNWMNIAREFSANFTVFLIDQRNHGNSPHSHAHNYDDMASDLKLICDKEQLNQICLIGHSMGGKTAISFTLKFPGVVQKLIVVDISPYSYLDLKRFEPEASHHELILNTFKSAPVDTIKSRTDMDDYFSQFISNTSTRRFLLKNLKRDRSSKFYWQLNVQALLANLSNVIDGAPQVKFGSQSFIPCLFIHGGQSRYISNDEIEAIPDVFPNATFEKFENSGHWLHAEEPDRFIRTSLEFLS